tara:strand:+ start:136 stop:576 length:441 start_codon:yes stop_codon:yes gene_type:complete
MNDIKEYSFKEIKLVAKEGVQRLKYPATITMNNADDFWKLRDRIHPTEFVFEVFEDGEGLNAKLEEKYLFDSHNFHIESLTEHIIPINKLKKGYYKIYVFGIDLVKEENDIIGGEEFLISDSYNKITGYEIWEVDKVLEKSTPYLF